MRVRACAYDVCGRVVHKADSRPCVGDKAVPVAETAHPFLVVRSETSSRTSVECHCLETLRPDTGERQVNGSGERR